MGDEYYDFNYFALIPWVATVNVVVQPLSAIILFCVDIYLYKMGISIL